MGIIASVGRHQIKTFWTTYLCRVNDLKNPGRVCFFGGAHNRGKRSIRAIALFRLLGYLYHCRCC